MLGIKENREKLGLSQEDLANELGVTRNTIANWEKSGKMPKAQERRVEKQLEELNQRKVAPTPSNEVSNKIDASLPISKQPNMSDLIPYYEVDVMAGKDHLFNDIRESPSMYISFPGLLDCDFACRVSGNSMEDKIHAGDIIACKEILDRRILAYGDIHLIITAEHRFVKTLRKGNERGSLILRSHNKEYDDIDVMIDDILKIYLVKGILKKTQI